MQHPHAAVIYFCIIIYTIIYSFILLSLSLSFSLSLSLFLFYSILFSSILFFFFIPCQRKLYHILCSSIVFYFSDCVSNITLLCYILFVITFFTIYILLSSLL